LYACLKCVLKPPDGGLLAVVPPVKHTEIRPGRRAFETKNVQRTTGAIGLTVPKIGAKSSVHFCDLRYLEGEEFPIKGLGFK
jgi:hypothetical protein